MFTHNNPELAARLRAGAAGVVVAAMTVSLGLNLIRSYGAWLFVVTPFAMGAATTFVYYRRRGADASAATTPLVVGTVLAAGSVMLLVAIEGVVCLIMALPIALPLAVLGGRLGRHVALSAAHSSSAMLLLIAIPLTAAVEPRAGGVAHEVESSVVIDAPPDAVWPHVIAFRDIPEPDDWLFRAGIAYPVRARIEGEGVGAVRYCVFSTGAFVEPITRWEPGRRLSFDVTASPPPMRELSLYRDLAPPHLHGYLRPSRGEFRLVDLGDGRTRLEGSTWYALEMAPDIYWRLFADRLIHRIHDRVLDHIKRETEAEAGAP